MMRPEISDVLASLDTVDSIESFSKLLDKSCDALGYSSYVYTAINTETIFQTKLTEAVDDIILVSNLKNGWLDHYFKENYANCDPIILDSIKARTPIKWT